MAIRNITDADARANFLARLEYGLNPVLNLAGTYRESAPKAGSVTFLCQNGGGPGRCVNTNRSLTRSSGTSREGLGSW